MTYAAVACVGAIILLGAVMIPGAFPQVEIKSGSLEFPPNNDAQTVKPRLVLDYAFGSESDPIFDDVKFDDGILNSHFQMQNSKVDVKENTIIITLEDIPYEEARKVVQTTGVIRWMRYDGGKKESLEFSFKIGPVEYPVKVTVMSEHPQEIKEEKDFEIEVKVDILDSFPHESLPLTLEAVAGNENVKCTENSVPLAETTTHRFKFRALKEGNSKIIFNVTGGENKTLWCTEVKTISVLKLNKVRLTDVRLEVEEDSRNYWPGEEVLLNFSTSDEEYTHCLYFSVKGSGRRIIIIVYYEVPYENFSSLVMEKSLVENRTFHGFLDSPYGRLFVIDSLTGTKEIAVRFTNPKSEIDYEKEKEVLRVALIRTMEENCLGTDFAKHISDYELNCPSPHDGGCYQYCYEEFTLQFQKASSQNSEEDDDIDIVLGYIGFLTFLLSYIILRRGGIP